MNTCSKHSYETEAQELKKLLFMEDIFYSHCLRYIYKKAVVCDGVPLFYTTKKRDCTVAVPHLKALELPIT